jgi:OFA family oxalate/formate antiporter-like MFS transporter
MKVKNRWSIVAGALIIQAILGTVYAYSVFVKPLETEFGWSRSTTQWGFSIALVTFALVMIPAGRLQDQWGPRKIAMIGGGLLGVAFLLGSALIDASRPWALYLTYGIIGGAGIGFGYVCPIAASVKWFPDKKGFITGLAVAGFGAGALFFAGPASELLQPQGTAENLGMGEVIKIGLGIAESEGSGIGWRRFFILHGIVAAAAVIGGAMLLSNPPEGYVPEGYTPPATSTRAKKNYTPLEMLNTPLAGMMWITFIFGATSGLMAIGQWKPMMAAKLGGQSFVPTELGTLSRFLEPVGILAIFNALGRIFWGRVSDVIGRPRAMTIMFLLQGAAFMFLVSVKSVLGIFLASSWVGLNFGGNFALFPTATADYFGTKHLGINYGMIFTAYGVAGILGPAVGGVLYDATQSYLMAFVFAGVLCFIAAAGSLVVWGFDKEHHADLPLSSPGNVMRNA